MERIPQSPPLIQPLAKDINRLLWSVMIPVYNCSNFLAEALQSVLSQNVGPDVMQIEVIDDASTDADVEALVQSIGQGRVTYFRQDQNVGSLRNFETCLNRAKGKLVHLLHGDDRVVLGFYSKFTQLFEQFPQAGAAFCQYSYIDAEGKWYSVRGTQSETDGILPDLLPRLAYLNRLQYVAMVVKRSVYEHVGSFYGVTFGEDWEMWARIARLYQVAYTPDLLAEYRLHNQSISNSKMASGQVLSDIRIVSNTIQTYLPESHYKHFFVKSRKFYLVYGMYGAYNSWKVSGNIGTIYNSIREGFKLYSGLFFYLILLRVFLKIMLHRYLFNEPIRAKKVEKLFHRLGIKVPD